MKTLTIKQRRDYAAPALATFFNICRAWDLNNTQAQILLGVSTESTFYNWKKQPKNAILNNDTIERLSYIFGIYKALQILLQNPDIADKWISMPNSNPLFNGQSPLKRMLSGHVSDLYVVRQYLDAVRGGWS